jgi:D-arabinose 1-dehydrogenase-like Zn-dependent alcohol dehydrogenase
MNAFQLLEHGTPGRFELRDVPRPSPGPEEVVVQVRACGLNHLDLWLEEAGLPLPIKLPRTPGGEAAGQIAEIGKEVRGWSLGDRVAVQSNLFCGECEFCRQGEESMCLFTQLRAGGWRIGETVLCIAEYCAPAGECGLRHPGCATLAEAWPCTC